MIFFYYLDIFLWIILGVFILVQLTEFIICVARKLSPQVRSGDPMRAAVVGQIREFAPNAKTVIDIGSGFGTMTRSVARAFPCADVIGIEIMPTPYLYSLVRGMLFKNVKLTFGNAFKFLDNYNKKFDVGITYLLTPEMPKVQKYMSRFKVLMVLDFPLPDATPVKTIKLHRDFLGQHYLYVYKQ